jgi:hypothetical protein
MKIDELAHTAIAQTNKKQKNTAVCLKFSGEQQDG